MSKKKLSKMAIPIISGRTLIFILIAAIGVIQIFIQLLLPDLAPDAVNNLLTQNHSQFISYGLSLKLSLFLWFCGGIVLFIGGILAAIINHIWTMAFKPIPLLKTSL